MAEASNLVERISHKSATAMELHVPSRHAMWVHSLRVKSSNHMRHEAARCRRINASKAAGSYQPTSAELAAKQDGRAA